MAKSDTGKILAALGGFLGLIIVLLALIQDLQMLGWWEIVGENIPFLGRESGYINAFGYSSNTINEDVEFLEDGTLVFISGIIFVVFCILMIITAIKEEKTYAIICAIGMFAGMFLFCYALSANPNLSDAVDIADDFFGGTGNIFYGTATILGIDTTWRLGNGFIVAVIASIIALVGAVKID